MRTRFRLYVGRAIALGLITLAGATGQLIAQEEEAADPPEVLLGERLFMDDRFSSPDGDRRISCRTCHLVDEELETRGMRAYTDFEAHSRVPVRNYDSYNQELRNSPTMVDAALMPFLHWDGEFTSLEQLTRVTLSGRNMGWLKGEEEMALDQAYKVLIEDTGIKADAEKDIEAAPPYVDAFKEVYDVDLKALTRDEAIEWIAKSTADYMRSLVRRNDSPYDEFIALNGLEDGPAAGQDPKIYAERHLRRIERREKSGSLKLSETFSAEALKGAKIFFAKGNCASCHVPPAFTDFSFHNVGISQLEFDRMHGEGSFADMKIPNAAEAKRPNEQFMGIPSGREPEAMDLGFWNRVDLKTSVLRRAEEPEEQFLTRMIATFKTPTLRNLKFTNPYMHNGGFTTIEHAMEEIIDSSTLARAGKIRSADDELAKIMIDESDISPLVAFLNALNEVYD